jgi:hypothetical protein
LRAVYATGLDHLNDSNVPVGSKQMCHLNDENLPIDIVNLIRIVPFITDSIGSDKKELDVEQSLLVNMVLVTLYRSPFI